MMTQMNRRTMLAATAGATATALAGGLGDGNEQEFDGGGTGDLSDPTDHAEVVLTGRPNPGFAMSYASLSFGPEIVHIVSGGTVQWLIEGHEKIDDHQHSLTAYHPDTHRSQRVPDETEPWESGLLFEGDTYEHTFEQEGIHDYLDNRQLCISHEMLGAVGRVVVGWPDVESEPAYRHNVGRLPGKAETTLTEIDERTVIAFAE